MRTEHKHIISDVLDEQLRCHQKSVYAYYSGFLGSEQSVGFNLVTQTEITTKHY